MVAFPPPPPPNTTPADANKRRGLHGRPRHARHAAKEFIHTPPAEAQSAHPLALDLCLSVYRKECRASPGRFFPVPQRAGSGKSARVARHGQAQRLPQRGRATAARRVDRTSAGQNKRKPVYRRAPRRARCSASSACRHGSTRRARRGFSGCFICSTPSIRVTHATLGR